MSEGENRKCEYMGRHGNLGKPCGRLAIRAVYIGDIPFIWYCRECALQVEKDLFGGRRSH
jgi:hypothetical protein